MKELFLLNTPSGLKPMYDEDYEEKKKLKIGKVYKAKIYDIKERSLQFHKKYFALINIGFDNTKLDKDGVVKLNLNTYRVLMQMKAGFADVFEVNGVKIAIPQSISFGSMDADTFEKLYSRVLDQIIIDIQADRELIEKELLSFL